MPNVVKGLPNIFLKAMGSANAYFDTIIDCNMNDRMYFKRFLPPDDVQAKVMKREAYIPVNDLEKYKIRVKAEISIGTKEFMAILLYAEANNVSVMDILFGEPGQPLIIVISETPEDFSAEFQISTVEGECSNYTRTENLSNASFSVSQLDMSNHRPDQRIQAKKRKTPVVVTEPVTRMPRLSFDPQRPSTSAAASEAAHNDSFNDDDDEELLSVVTEMSIRHNQLTQATQQRTQQSVIVIEDEEDEDVQPIKRHSPGANRTHRVESSHELDDPINDSAIQAISLPQNHDPVRASAGQSDAQIRVDHAQ
ncbi:hypothetical protein L596_024869 [Steinernema carpocapsae]|uniref:Uncharacterized protein n=1 Tax=Steinernema carpocapsae TaxID=34508 RepID=A0A4U5M621_STECR|nr:hypothetical protein L596_024869 [Steinernema carpocapsae]